MARFYSNENFPLPAVKLLRGMGHDVLTTIEMGKANQSIPDDEVLHFAASEGRCVLTLNRCDFVELHAQHPAHFGIVACTVDNDYERLAANIHAAVGEQDLRGQLLKVYRTPPGSKRRA